MVGTRPQGGLMNLMNDRGEVVFIAGAADEGAGGALLVRNGSGKQVFHAGYDRDGNGLVTVWDERGINRRTLSPLR
jgi:hypothetical protein